MRQENKRLFTMLCFSFLSMNIGANPPLTQSEATKSLYTNSAKEYLATIVAIKEKSTDLDKKGLIEFLNNRINNANNILAGDRSSFEKECKSLDPEWIFLFTLNDLEDNPNARAVFYFSKMAQINLAYTLRIKLGCRLGEVDDVEKPYADLIKKVSKEEYLEKFNAISSDELDNLRLQVSKNFAQAVLDTPTN